MATTELNPVEKMAEVEASTQVPQFANHKTKLKKRGQRACNVKDEKGKICGGHLKHWFYAVDKVEQACGDIEKVLGKDAEVYRCEHCKTVYFPNPTDPRGKNVAGVGKESVFGLTLPPKEGGEKA